MTRSCDIIGLCGPPPASCADDYRRVRRECDVDTAENNRFRDRLQDRNRSAANRARKNGRRAPEPYHIRNMTWKDKHCGSALFGTNRNSLENAAADIENLGNEFKEYLEELIDELPANVAQEIAASIPERAVRKVGCAAFGPLAWACAAVSTAYDVYEMSQEAMQALEQLRGLQDELAQLQDLLEDADAIREGLNDPEKMEAFRQEKIEEMVQAAQTDPCLRARACILTPYQNKGVQGSYPAGNPSGTRRPLMDSFGREPHTVYDPRGCCPGMTGHHLINGAWVRDNCSNYNHNSAPVVCVAGANQREGQHGELHRASDRMLEDYACDFTLDDAKEIAIESLGETIGNHCDEDCIESQLEQYYDQAGCGQNQLTPKTSNNRDLSADCAPAMS